MADIMKTNDDNSPKMVPLDELFYMEQLCNLLIEKMFLTGIDCIAEIQKYETEVLSKRQIS